MHTALPQPPPPFFYSFQVLWKSILQIFSPSLKKVSSFFKSFFYFPQDPICFLYLVPLFIYTHPSLFPKRIPLVPCILLPCLLFFSFLFCNSSIATKLPLLFARAKQQKVMFLNFSWFYEFFFLLFTLACKSTKRNSTTPSNYHQGLGSSTKLP